MFNWFPLVSPVWAADVGGGAGGGTQASDAGTQGGKPASDAGGPGGGEHPPSGGSAGEIGWRASLPDEIREDPALSKLTSVEALAREHVNSQAMLGRKGAIIPGDSATPEEWHAFHVAGGKPETVDKYDLGDFKPPEGVEFEPDAQAAFNEAAFDAGLSNSQLRKVMDHYANKYIPSVMEARVADQEEQRAEGEALLRREFGSKDYDAKLAGVADLLRGLAGDNYPKLKAELEGPNGAGRNPYFAMALSKIASHFAEDGVMPAGLGGGFGGGSPAAAQAEIKKIRDAAIADPKHPYNDAAHPENKALHKRMMALTEAANRSS